MGMRFGAFEGVLKLVSVDLDVRLLVILGGNRADNTTDRIDYTAMLANHLANVIWINGNEVILALAFARMAYFNGTGIINNAFYDVGNEFGHLN